MQAVRQVNETTQLPSPYEQTIQTKNFFLRKRIAFSELFHLQVLVCGIFLITRRSVSSFVDLSLTKNKCSTISANAAAMLVGPEELEPNFKRRNTARTIAQPMISVTVKILDICLRLKLQKYTGKQLTDQI